MGTPAGPGSQAQEANLSTSSPVAPPNSPPGPSAGLAAATSLAVVRLPGPRADLVVLGLEVQGQRVDAVALAGRLRTVVEYVPQVRLARRAEDLGAAHEQAVVGLGIHRVVLGRRREAGPAGARVELGLRGEQLGAAGRAPIHARLLVGV